MKKFLFIMTLWGTSLFSGTINIAVAANLSYVMPDLKKEFNKLYPDTKVQVILGGSGKLTAQIKNGAPYQLLMSADMQYPKALYHDRVAITKPLVYAQGSLVYLSSQKRDFTQGMQLLKASNIHKIAIANPITAPYGKAAVDAMQKSGIYEAVAAKFVKGESISQTVAFTLKAADIGLVAKSALFSPKMAGYLKGVNWAEVDPALYQPINQGIVILKKGEKDAEVAAFYAFMFSRKAKTVLSHFGYLLP